MAQHGHVMYDRGFDEPPALPQISEQQEVQDALAKKLICYPAIAMSRLFRRPSMLMASCPAAFQDRTARTRLSLRAKI
jgi:hypothetical protein